MAAGFAGKRAYRQGSREDATGKKEAADAAAS